MLQQTSDFENKLYYFRWDIDRTGLNHHAVSDSWWDVRMLTFWTTLRDLNYAFYTSGGLKQDA